MSPAVPNSRGSWLLVVLALALLVIGVVGLIAHFRAPGRAWVLGVSAFSPYLMLGAPLAMLLSLVGRQWLAAVVALILTAICVATQVPLYGSADPPPNAVALTVMTFNLRLGEASPNDVVAAVRRHHVDVLMLEELTPQEHIQLIAAGLDKALPHHISDPRPFAEGTGLWARYPLEEATKRTDFHLAFVTAMVRINGAVPVVLAAAHMSGPWPHPFFWHLDIAHLAQVLPTLEGTGAAILGGDLNATPDEAQFRALLTHGWADSAAQAGAGMTRTYPADKPFPPLIAIDHVLTHDAVATSAQTVEIPGSDHRALVVQVAIPRS